MIFAGNPLDRASPLRLDEQALSRAARAESARIVPVWNSRHLISGDEGRAVYVKLDELPQTRLADLVFLGRRGGCDYFAYDIAASREPAFAGQARFRELRELGALLPMRDAAILAYANALLSWRSKHRFCANCGSPTESIRAGHVLRCTSSACGLEQFPRLDPAIIVLVTEGSRVLLGRQASWPAGRFSTLAGFVEPGESFEDAVKREVMEETGIEVGDCQYFASQPWPFPSSLMIGFHARALSTQIKPLDAELEKAEWFDARQIAALQRREGGFLPPRASISFCLIAHWYEAQGVGKLEEICADNARSTT